jgi:NAD(P)H-dependent FMN reductase
MRITIVNGTNRFGSHTIRVARIVEQISKDLGFITSFVNLMSFTKVYKDEYVLAIDYSDPFQARKLFELQNSDVVLFVAPAYSQSDPKALKNFISLTEPMGLFSNKVIGLISVCSNKDMRLEHANFLLEFFEELEDDDQLVLTKRILLDHEKPEIKKIESYIAYCSEFSEIFEK